MAGVTGELGSFSSMIAFSLCSNSNKCSISILPTWGPVKRGQLIKREMQLTLTIVLLFHLSALTSACSQFQGAQFYEESGYKDVLENDEMLSLKNSKDLATKLAATTMTTAPTTTITSSSLSSSSSTSSASSSSSTSTPPPPASSTTTTTSTPAPSFASTSISRAATMPTQAASFNGTRTETRTEGLITPADISTFRLEYNKYRILSHLSITGNLDERQPEIDFDLRDKLISATAFNDQQTTSSRHKRSLSCDEVKSQKDACCLENFYVNFTHIGWDKWILYPTGYNANYCRGQCDLSHARYYHSTLLSKYSNMISLCCSPKQMAPLKLLYIDEDNKVHQKSIPDMIVESCDCA